MAEVFHVDADLMGAAGVEGALEEGADAGDLLGDAPGGAGGAAAAVQDGHLFAMDGVAADLVFDDAGALVGEVALNEGEVDFCDGAAGELAGEMGVGGVCDGYYEAAAGVFVEAVDDAGTLLAADAG
jgi:hypothetical protein